MVHPKYPAKRKLATNRYIEGLGICDKFVERFATREDAERWIEENKGKLEAEAIRDDSWVHKAIESGVGQGDGESSWKRKYGYNKARFENYG